MTSLPVKFAASAATALALSASLAACTAAPAAETPAGETTSGDYTDGTYESEGTYQSPNGTESIDVTVTLEGNVITDVEVVGNGESPDSKRYQGEFIGGIDEIVVGKNIDEIQVDRVAGSSLTSGGFNRAIDAIKQEAAA